MTAPSTPDGIVGTELENIEEIAAQTTPSVNESRNRRGGKAYIKFRLPSNLARAHVEREQIDRAAKPDVAKVQGAIRPDAAYPVPSSAEVTSYSELIASIEAKRQVLNIKQADFDKLAGFAEGLWGKVAGLLQVKQVRVEKLFDALRAAGLRLRIEDDPEQDAKMRDRIANKYNPRQANQARPGHSASLPSTAVLNRVMQPWRKIGGKKRWHKTTPEERSAHMRMMAMAGVRKRRKEMKKRARQRKRAHEARKEAFEARSQSAGA